MRAADLEAAFASLPPAWAAVLPGWTLERLWAVQRRVEAVSADRPIAPEDPFRALRLVAPADVKVVVIGQDPYPSPGHADGLAFSAGHGRPRSLARIFEVLAADRPGRFEPPEVWKLDAWASRGVLLLNPVLTVEVGRSGSHHACGWQALTAEIVQVLARYPDPPVSLLWGSKAQAFWADAVSGGKATALCTRHPAYDFRRAFMAEGSHFEATAERVDWWAVGKRESPVL
ncbi:MAG: uracil-DNA glycosylase [Pseudomonadota bacterium]|nr:uracil-DNA glycosylase [Pseudomonadota bacterium]